MMENQYHREGILLGYTSRRSLGNPTPSPKISHRRASDVDFSDVFGGPPRRSMPESCSNSSATFGSMAEKEESLQSFSNPWSSLKENPVFGEERQRRSHLKEDFFHDIFKVDETLNSTPKQSDPFSSMPGSTVQSPVHPSLSRQLSFTANLAKGISSPTFGPAPGGFSGQFGFPSSPRASRIAAQIAAQSRPPQRHSSLSDQFTLNSDESVKTLEPTGQDMGSQYKKGADSSDVSTNKSKFHFSIYKWASKGAPLTMQFRKGDRLNLPAKRNDMGIVNSSLETTPEVINMSSESEVLSTTEPQFHSQDAQPSERRNKNEEPAPAELAHAKPAVETLYRLLNKTSEPEEEIEQQPAELQFSEVKEDNYDRAGNHEMQQQSGQFSRTLRNAKTVLAENHETVKVKQQIGKKNILHQKEESKASMQEVKSEEKRMGSGTKGKVKEFVKIFNLEASAKPTPSKDRPIQNPRKTGTAASEIDNKMGKGNTDKTKTDSDVAFERSNLRNPSQQNAAINFNNKQTVDPVTEKSNIKQSVDPPMEKSSIFSESSGTTSESLDSSVGNTLEILSEDLEALDTKIWQWSTGREGNIRSLLSTLQYVLWPDSGWKPIPLVDIIEGICVKKAYQKALLCLHPDKLQQKGAGMQQKYIAEKVFDILQEAWTHFNTLGSL